MLVDGLLSEVGGEGTENRTGFYDTLHIVDNVLWFLRLSVLDCYRDARPADVLHRGVDEMGFGNGMLFDVNAFDDGILPLDFGAVPGRWVGDTHRCL